MMIRSQNQANHLPKILNLKMASLKLPPQNLRRSRFPKKARPKTKRPQRTPLPKKRHRNLPSKRKKLKILQNRMYPPKGKKKRNSLPHLPLKAIGF